MISESLFSFQLPTKILFGVGALANLGTELDERGWDSALIVTDQGVRAAGLLARLEAQLQACGAQYEVYDGVVSNPTVAVIEAAQPLAQKQQVLIGLGGGSSIDTAKALNLLRTHGGHVLDWEGNETVPGPCGPLIAIPTTAGTGSEVTCIAQVSVPERKEKLPIISRYLAPDIALVDPQMSASMPARLTAATGMDALTHAIEAATTLAEQPLADLLAFQAIPLINTFLPRAVQDGADMEARAQLAFASTIAGAAFNNGWVALAHAVAHALGGLYDLHHGLCCSLALPLAMEFNLEVKREKYLRIAELLGQTTAEAGIARVRELAREIGIPSGLRELGLSADEGELEKIAQLALSDGSIFFNPREVGEEEMKRLVREIF
ncbi:MAG TPA: iron-containing alcohol dehydrogenase [Candidatus Fraserbacteria bacterium]|nr:iron-containing alcohol dehydrogenase [Candidatus Fraserbacteria bacterium]